jgi:hypothetical protein
MACAHACRPSGLRRSYSVSPGPGVGVDVEDVGEGDA